MSTGPQLAASLPAAPPAPVSTVTASDDPPPLVSAAAPARPDEVASAAAPRDPRTVATVGALFSSGVASPHSCTAGVVDSPSGNVIVTAAHCVVGSAAGMVFVPGYVDGDAPYGSWTVTKAYAATGWITGQSPRLDYAFLVVSPSSTNATTVSLQSVTGGNVLGTAPAPGQTVTVAGYEIGRDDEPVICAPRVYLTRGYPSFDCAGYVAGTSGAPWIVGYQSSTGAGTITAVIGGLNQGGCTAGTSYGAPFTAATEQLLARAAAGGPADVLPVPLPATC
jgi:V8-like Glu-specific endopeptidase